ncbi:hypothetical protein C8R43DRAFT_1088748 [Mycena crocata]|nr:hypothetical protein C8R43DRAFT_1088748 [Mycena crocata]
MACSLCGEAHGEGRRLFCCSQCGEFLQCHDCVKSRHQLNPAHLIREWNGACWTEAQLNGTTPDPQTGLIGVGLVFQLGHHGLPCEFPDNGWYPATTVDPATCSTLQVLELFWLLNVVGNVNVHDFVGTLERLTDPLRMSTVPDRYKAFGRSARQWGFLGRGKRSGRGHVPSGLRKTPAGGTALLCGPCPQDGWNLPEGWREVPPAYKYLYMLLLALDANFRFKNRLRANEHDDPSLGLGAAYFVEQSGYREHLKNYVAEKDVSSCIVFAALLQKETRMTMGLRVSGVGGCVCARHGVVRPLGLGDLQKGEQYANMDYILLSALMGVTVLCLTISYDIACQWKINLPARAKKIADTTSITTNLEDFEIQYALPVWHAVAHGVSCQTQNSLSYAVGVGRTDGEGIERTWAVLNPISYSTKEMGDGARKDAIENKVDHLNWEKNVLQTELTNEQETLCRGSLLSPSRSGTNR